MNGSGKVLIPLRFEMRDLADIIIQAVGIELVRIAAVLYGSGPSKI